jgi:hypothetical protein
MMLVDFILLNVLCHAFASLFLSLLLLLHGRGDATGFLASKFQPLSGGYTFFA